VTGKLAPVVTGAGLARKLWLANRRDLVIPLSVDGYNCQWASLPKADLPHTR